MQTEYDGWPVTKGRFKRAAVGRGSSTGGRTLRTRRPCRSLPSCTARRSRPSRRGTPAGTARTRRAAS